MKYLAVNCKHPAIVDADDLGDGTLDVYAPLGFIMENGHIVPSYTLTRIDDRVGPPRSLVNVEAQEIARRFRYREPEPKQEKESNYSDSYGF